ncbi:MAG: hypothetical protein K2X93_22140 [Candidatus Obscuribacterales bacterium]|nr:hypothetical protein [Candidatus Obscuribacterales bacterium]
MPKLWSRIQVRQIQLIVDTGNKSGAQAPGQGNSEQFEQNAVFTCPSCGLADWAIAFQQDQRASGVELGYSTRSVNVLDFGTNRTGKRFPLVRFAPDDYVTQFARLNDTEDWLRQFH